MDLIYHKGLLPQLYVGMVDNPCSNCHSMRICLLFVLFMFLQGLLGDESN